MQEDQTEKLILQALKESHKSFAFDESHDPTLPAQWWFQQSHEGLVFFVVFYSQACRWSRCLGCNLPSKCSQHHIDFKALMSQIDHVFELPEVVQSQGEIRQVIVSNNGSMLDEVTFSTAALAYLLAKINLFLPRVSILTLETRPEYVDLAELELMSRILREGDTPTELEVAIGFEAFDDRIRNEVFLKGLSLDAFEKLIDDLAPYGFGVKCYLMQKPVPGMSDVEGIEDVEKAIDYLSDLSRRKKVKISIHLNPTYVASGTILAESLATGEYTPPTLVDVAKAVSHAKGKGLSIFIGLYDEDLAVDGGSFVRPGEAAVVKKLERFNQTADYAILEGIYGR